jgi:uncharacterized protein YyaL (SSP411 family)
MSLYNAYQWSIRIAITLIFLSTRSILLPAQEIQWQDFNTATFQKALQENKPVLLDLGASWCHWCHVMDDSTYKDPAVIKYLSDNYIAIRSNQDKRPDLYARYKDYGWPATIIFDSHANELVKQAGFIAPDEFLDLLKTTKSKNGAPRKQVASSNSNVAASWSDNTAQYIRDDYYSYLDFKKGGYDMQQKFLDADGIAYALLHYKTDPRLRSWLKTSIHQSYKINDPAWGGVYQYSTNDDWEHPHFEKLLGIQAKYLKIYANYYTLFQDTTSREHALKIVAYLHQFFKGPDGLYYNSQDADLIQGVQAANYFKLSGKDRLKRGIPLIDSTCYVRENAQLASSLIDIATATRDSTYLYEARTILQSLISKYKQPNHAYLHGPTFTGAYALGDQVYMCQALLDYYQVTREQWSLQETQQIAAYISNTLKSDTGGFLSFTATDHVLPADRMLSENIAVCRVFNRLYAYTHDAGTKQLADHAFRYISSPAVLKDIIAEPAILIAKEEIDKAGH